VSVKLWIVAIALHSIHAQEYFMAIVRISLGRFDADKFELVRKLLDDSQKTLIPAIRKLKGNRSYHVGIDRENSAMTNMSIWETRDDAQQMASLQAMADLAKIFVDVGVRF
jgi:quinol monooxygenase YgiN